MSADLVANHSPESVLVVRLGAMGDVIHTLYAVTTLRAAFPKTKIGWVIEERWAELLCARGTSRSGPPSCTRPVVDFVHAVDTKRWRKWLLSRQTWAEFGAAFREIRNQGYEIAVDFQGAIKSAVIARCSRAKPILGLQHPREVPAKFFYTQRIATNDVHVIDQYRSLPEAWAGAKLPYLRPEFPRDEQAEAAISARLREMGKEFAVINPGAGWAAKEWPAERYGEVAKALSGHGLVPLVNFGPGEEKLAAAVRDSSGGTAVPLSCPIGELIALVRRARLFLGGDTGPLHLAAALRVPAVAIFGPTDPARNGPYGARSIALRSPASQTSLSHTNQPDAGLLQITAEAVIIAARRLLEEPRA